MRNPSPTIPPISTLKSGMRRYLVWTAIVMPRTMVMRPKPLSTVWRVFSGNRLPSRTPVIPPTMTVTVFRSVPVIGRCMMVAGEGE